MEPCGFRTLQVVGVEENLPRNNPTAGEFFCRSTGRNHARQPKEGNCDEQTEAKHWEGTFQVPAPAVHSDEKD
jgi:hypothetical protein